tara:strand:+ start:557 stop:931 length:375 start_codon:yes stop_codon:yes gene_type:complete
MTWKEILKSGQPLTPEDEQEIQDLMRFRNMDRQEAERHYRFNQRRKSGQSKTSNVSYDDYMRNYKSEIEEEILDEVEDEGGALGMKNLKDIADKNKLKETISDMKEEGKLFEHKHGDFYTHQPK